MRGPVRGRLAAPIKDLAVALAIEGEVPHSGQNGLLLGDISAACSGDVPDAALSTMGQWTKICRLCHGTYS